MNTTTGQLGHLVDLLRDAKPGERVIPAILIPEPKTAPVLYGPRRPLREVRKELQAAKAAAED